MKTEYRSIIAIALSAGVMIIWYTIFSPPPKQPQPPTETTSVTQTSTPPLAATVVKKDEAAGNKENKIPDVQSNIPVKTATIDTELASVTFTNDGAIPTSWTLKKYRQQTSGENDFINLAPASPGGMPAVALRFSNTNFEIPENPRYELISQTQDEIAYRWASPEIELIKKIKFSADSYVADISVELTNRTKRVLTEQPGLFWGGEFLPSQKSGFFSFLKQPPATNKSPVYFLGGSVKREINVAKIPEKEEFSGALFWAGIEDRYFLSAIIPREQSSQMAVRIGAANMGEPAGGRFVYSGTLLPSASIPPGDKIVHKFSAYAGPKEVNQLKAVGVHLEEAIDYGWFTVIAMPILYLLKFFHSIVRNYGLAIIVLTIFIKLLLHPINVKSMKSMKQMQNLQPRLKELQAKYKDDKTRLNTETMQLFKTHKVNPMGGCLPMLLQFPIYIALYKVLWNSIELYRAPFFWFYKDLSAPDPYLITPILLGIWMVLQQRLMPSTTADPMQQKMMTIMPVMFSVFMLFLPVGLVIYILVNTVMSVVQQWMHNHDIGYKEILNWTWKAKLAKS